MADVAVLEGIDVKFKAIYPQNFVDDGVIDLAAFSLAKRKILWVLKDANDPEQGAWSLREVIRDSLLDSSRWQYTFGLPVQISWAVLNGEEDYAKVPQSEKIADVLKQTAFINLKKVGGGAKSDSVEIAQFYKKDKALIKEQVEAIAPDIIINCSGEKSFFDDMKTGEAVEVGRFLRAPYREGVIIDAYHPNARNITHEAYFQNITECLKGLKA
jgi:hypothetical protein